MSGIGSIFDTIGKVAPAIGAIGTIASLGRGSFGSPSFPTVSNAGIPGLTGISTPSYSLIGGNLFRKSNPETDAMRSGVLGSLGANLNAKSPNIDAARATLSELVRATASPFGAERDRALASYDNLAGQVAPGFGALSQNVTETINARKAEAVGNLRESLAKRRIAGASFADAEIAKTEMDFARQEQQAKAEAKVQEIALSEQIAKGRAMLVQDFAKLSTAQVNQQAQIVAQQAELDLTEAQAFATRMTGIKAANDTLSQQSYDELRELGVAGNILNGLQNVISRNAQFDAQTEINALQAQGYNQSALFRFLNGDSSSFGGGNPVRTITDSIQNLGSYFGGGADSFLSSGGAADALGLPSFSGAAGAAPSGGAAFGAAGGAADALGLGGGAIGGNATLFGGAGAPLGGLGLLGPGLALGIGAYGLSQISDDSADTPPDPRFIPIWQGVGQAFQSGSLTDAQVDQLIQSVGINDAYGIIAGIAEPGSAERSWVPRVSAAARARAKKIADQLRPAAFAMDDHARSVVGI